MNLHGTSNGNGKTILLADQDECVRLLVREYLESAGFEVKDAATASEALRLAGAWGRGRPDLLMSAVQLPDASGAWLAGQLRHKNRPDMAAVYLVWDDLNMETLFGPDRHVQKPFSFLQIHEAVEEALVAVEPELPSARPLQWYGFGAEA